MRVNNLKFPYKNETYNFYYPINGKRQTPGYKRILLGRTYPLLKNFNPKIILDVGANLGATTMFFALNYPKAKIMSLEPSEMNFRWLERNTMNFKNVTRIKKGAYSRDTKAKIYLDSESGGRNSIYKGWTKSDKYEIIDLVNFGTFLVSNNLENKIDILKIDTEGCEIDILSSIENYLENTQVIYLEYHDKKDEDIIREILSKSHFIAQKKAIAQQSKKITLKLVGTFCLEDVSFGGETILGAGKKITETHIKKLEKLPIQTLLVSSDNLGELVFINKNLDYHK